jgi:hypothetical protein
MAVLGGAQFLPATRACPTVPAEGGAFRAGSMLSWLRPLDNQVKPVDNSSHGGSLAPAPFLQPWRCAGFQPPDAENRTSGGVGGCGPRSPSPDPVQWPGLLGLLHTDLCAFGAFPLSILVVDVALEFLHPNFAGFAGHGRLRERRRRPPAPPAICLIRPVRGPRGHRRRLLPE